MKTKTQLNISEVWESFYETHENTYRNLLMEQYEDLVRYAARKLHRILPNHVELDDLYSAGQFGLMNAIDAYDPARGFKFETFCIPRVKGAMLDELRRLDWVPRLARTRAQQLSRATDALRSDLGRKPLVQELADELNISVVEITRMQRDAKIVGLISLQAKAGGNDEHKEMFEIEVIPDKKSVSPLIEAQKKDLKNYLTKGLSRAERLIIVLYYYEELTMKEISITLDLSESRVSQMHSLILARLKAQMGTYQQQLSLV